MHASISSSFFYNSLTNARHEIKRSHKCWGKIGGKLYSTWEVHKVCDICKTCTQCETAKWQTGSRLQMILVSDFHHLLTEFCPAGYLNAYKNDSLTFKTAHELVTKISFQNMIKPIEPVTLHCLLTQNQVQNLALLSLQKVRREGVCLHSF